MKGIDGKIKTRWKSIGTMLVLAAAAVCIVVFLFLRLPAVLEVIKKIISILMPFIIGIILCYLVNPLYKKITAFGEKKKINQTVSKALATVACVLAVVIVIYGIIALLIPSLYESLKNLYDKGPELIARISDWYKELEKSDFTYKGPLIDLYRSVTVYFENFVQESIIPNLNTIFSQLYSKVVSAASFVYDFLIGLVAMAYLLNYQDVLIPKVRKLLYSLFPLRAPEICDKIRLFNRIFGGFISGKLLDSLIIGILCYIGMLFFRIPYAMLVSVIIGVTNIIPFFGPFIGAIPSSILIMLIDPAKGLLFIVFIFLLQQLDGNVIGPRVLGDSIGISSLSVLFSIILFGGLFGFVGMFLGVPIWAFICEVIEEKTRRRLKRSGYPLEDDSYTDENMPVKRRKEKLTEH